MFSGAARASMFSELERGCRTVEFWNVAESSFCGANILHYMKCLHVSFALSFGFHLISLSVGAQFEATSVCLL